MIDTLAPNVPEMSAEPRIEDLLAKIDTEYTNPDGWTFSQAWKYREEVRAKYGLPECGGRWEDPQGYINYMEDMLAREGIAVRGKHEFKGFFEDFPGASAVVLGRSAFRDTTVVVTEASTNDWFGLRARANQLAHESVHAFQDTLYPGMSHEEAEREAHYYQMFYPQKIRELSDDPERLYRLFTDIIEPGIKKSVIINEKGD